MWQFVTRHLEVKLILAFILVLLIPTAAIATYGVANTRNTLIDKARPDSLKVIQARASTIENRIIDAKDEVLALAQNALVQEYTNVLARPGSNTRAIHNAPTVFQLESFLFNSPSHFKDVHILDTTGKELIGIDSQNLQPALIEDGNLENQADQAYFLRALELPVGSVYISRVSLNATHGTVDAPPLPIIRLSAPLFNQGTITAVLVAKLPLSEILTPVNSAASAETMYLVDSDGSYLLNPDPQQLYGRSLKTGITMGRDQPNDVSLIQAQGEGTLLGSLDHPDDLVAFTQVTLPQHPAIRWTLISRQPIRNLFGAINNAILVVLALAGIALIVAAIIAGFLTHRVMRPVGALTYSANAIAAGDLSQHISLTGDDEIGSLAKAFNKMSEELTVSYATLEQRVEERTAQLAEARSRAEESSKAKSIFMSNMSHELRTPLNVVIGYTSSMLGMPHMYDNVPLPPIYRSDIQLVQDNGKYLLGLINDILDLSKIEAGKLELHCEPVDLTRIFQGVIATATGLIKNKPLVIRPDFADQLPLVWADSMRIRQVILNLMANAVKFTEIGNVTLSARVEGSHLHISVSDTGIGIPEKALGYIFDRFSQAEQNTEKFYGGTGLGLDISKQLCLMHGSDLTVTSTEGQGSTFSFSLPFATPEQVQAVPEPETDPGSVAIFDDSVNEVSAVRAVLLVEDEVSLRNMLRRSLEGEGYLVIETDDGLRAFEMASQLQPNAIILDIRLPNMDGWMVLDKLKNSADTATIPVILYTASDSAERAEAAGVAAYLQKPIEPDMVLTRLNELLASKAEKGS